MDRASNPIILRCVAEACGEIISERLERVRSRIAQACDSNEPKRDPNEIKLVAVSKRIDVAAMQEAFDCGIRDFGENYVQEAQGKKQRMAQAKECTWHLIGPLQSNKAKQAAHVFDWVHSLDRIKVAKRLGAERVEAGMDEMQACIQVNLGAEQTKSGIAPAEVAGFLEQADAIDGIRIRGLMCIPEPGTDPSQKRRRFRELAQLLAKMQGRHPKLDTLSMGMSDDFEQAIMEGSTMVRIGTALLGPRP